MRKQMSTSRPRLVVSSSDISRGHDALCTGVSTLTLVYGSL